MYQNKKLIAIFKPDRPSRMEYFIKEFKECDKYFEFEIENAVLWAEKLDR